MRIPLLIIAAFGLTAFAPAAEPRDPVGQEREQEKAFRETREGRFIPLRTIEQHVISRMRGADYLGPELNGDRYRLKFMRDGRVIWIDIDARTGRFLGKSGN